jgi:hypothetical protein
VLWERSEELESPISDPDLAMVDPSRHPNDAPMLRGQALAHEALTDLYRGSCESFLSRVR